MVHLRFLTMVKTESFHEERPGIARKRVEMSVETGGRLLGLIDQGIDFAGNLVAPMEKLFCLGDEGFDALKRSGERDDQEKKSGCREHHADAQNSQTKQKDLPL
ncbi:MAG: hypothetical protein HY594_03935 [Candidatus Omnitrophica bacterium]|nr:hypothetical protein [Candidatus Omnitrophota bacterium]